MTQRAQCSTDGCDKPAKFTIDRSGEPQRYACEDDVAGDLIDRNQIEVPT